MHRPETTAQPGGPAGTDAPPTAAAARVAGQFGWISGGRLLAAVIQAVTLVLLARWTGPAAFGAVGIALSLVIVFQTVTDLGLPTFVVRERAAEPGNPAIRRALEFNNLTTRILALTLLMVFGAMGAFVQHDFYVLLPLAIWAAVDRNTDTWLGVALADGDARVNTIAILSRRVAAITMMVGLYATGAPALLAFSMSLAVVGVVVNAVAHRWASKRVHPSTVSVPIRPILRSSFPYWVNSTATQLRNVDALIIGATTGTAQLAFYAAASRITGPLRILPTSLATVLVPASARTGAANLRRLAKPVGALIAVMTVIYTAVIVAAPWAVPMLLGTDFDGAVLPMQIVCGGLVFAAIASILGAILQGLGRGPVVARIAVITTAACLIGVLVGSMFAAAVGASIALAGSFVVQAVLLAIALVKAGRRGDPESPAGAVLQPTKVGES